MSKKILLAAYTFLTVGLWLLLVNLAEYLLTEVWFIYVKLPKQLSFYLLVTLIFVLSLIFTLKMKNQSNQKLSLKLAVLAGIFLIAVLIAQRSYKKYYSSLQAYPKIKSVTKKWTIQGDRVAIIGRNFGEPWRAGTVTLNDVDYTIVSWSENKIIIEQPVIGETQQGQLVVTNYRSKQAFIDNFAIKNPTEVLK